MCYFCFPFLATLERSGLVCPHRLTLCLHGTQPVDLGCVVACRQGGSVYWKSCRQKSKTLICPVLSISKHVSFSIEFLILGWFFETIMTYWLIYCSNGKISHQWAFIPCVFSKSNSQSCSQTGLFSSWNWFELLQIQLEGLFWQGC